MLGRLVMSLEGIEISSVEEELIRNPKIAGIMLSSRNFENKEKLKKLVEHIQHLAFAAEKHHGLPVFVDQEGGHVQPFKAEFSAIPAAEVFGTAYNMECSVGLRLAWTFGQKMAKELAPFGIISLAPGVDPIIGGSSSAFHENPITRAKLCKSFIEGMSSVSMSATLKHFPGHVQSIGDSHDSVVVDTRSYEEIYRTDLAPLQELIVGGKAGAIMLSGTRYTQVDPNNTAGMSRRWLEILRNQLRFNGIVLSDCLSMQGPGTGTLLEKTTKALQFGDLALLRDQSASVLLDVANCLPDEYCMSDTVFSRYAEWVGGFQETRRQLSREYQARIRASDTSEGRTRTMVFSGRASDGTQEGPSVVQEAVPQAHGVKLN